MIGLIFPLPSLAQDPLAYRLLKLEGVTVKWGEPVQGANAVITYDFIGDNASFDDARNCRKMGPVTSIATHSEIEYSVIAQAAAEAFATWESFAGVQFKKAEAPNTADILIGTDLSGAGWAFADVKMQAAESGVGVINRGLVCLNAEKEWKIGFGNNLDAQDLRYTLIHEIGHAIGLNHASPHGQVMSFNYAEEFSSLQAGDIAGAQALYGEPRPTATSALDPAMIDASPALAN